MLALFTFDALVTTGCRRQRGGSQAGDAIPAAEGSNPQMRRLELVPTEGELIRRRGPPTRPTYLRLKPATAAMQTVRAPYSKEMMEIWITAWIARLMYILHLAALLLSAQCMPYWRGLRLERPAMPKRAPDEPPPQRSRCGKRRHEPLAPLPARLSCLVVVIATVCSLASRSNTPATAEQISITVARPSLVADPRHAQCHPQWPLLRITLLQS
jgi:hypothetical protein